MERHDAAAVPTGLRPSIPDDVAWLARAACGSRRATNGPSLSVRACQVHAWHAPGTGAQPSVGFELLLCLWNRACSALCFNKPSSRRLVSLRHCSNLVQYDPSCVGIMAAGQQRLEGRQSRARPMTDKVCQMPISHLCTEEMCNRRRFGHSSFVRKHAALACLPSDCVSRLAGALALPSLASSL